MTISPTADGMQRYSTGGKREKKNKEKKGKTGEMVRGRVNANFCVIAVRKIMDAMRTAYAKSGIQSRRVSNYTQGKRSRKAREICEKKKRASFANNISVFR